MVKSTNLHLHHTYVGICIHNNLIGIMQALPGMDHAWHSLIQSPAKHTCTCNLIHTHTHTRTNKYTYMYTRTQNTHAPLRTYADSHSLASVCGDRGIS